VEVEKLELEKTINDMKLKFEMAEKQAEERKEVEEKKHSEEIQFLKRTNQQLKVCYIRSIYTASFLDVEPYQSDSPWCLACHVELTVENILLHCVSFTNANDDCLLLIYIASIS